MGPDTVVEEEGQGWSWKTGSPEKKARMERFVEWTLTPANLREPASKAKLAVELGVHPNTLRNYQHDPAFQKAVTHRARSLVRTDRLPDVLDSLFVQASDPTNPRSVSAAKALLEFAQDTADVVEELDVKNMSQDDLVKVALELLHKVSGESAS